MSINNIIKLEKLNFFGFHGINDSEIKKGQIFILDVTVHYKVINDSDDIDNFIDYIKLYDLIKISFDEKRFNLLESLGAKILKDIKEKYDSVFYIKINMRKPSITIDNNQDFINVEVKYEE